MKSSLPAPTKAQSKRMYIIKAEIEEWKDVDGYGGKYKVSNRGRVKSVTHVTVDTTGRKRTFAGQLKKQMKHSAGYPVVSLHQKNMPVSRYVHRLVAEAFIGEAPEGLCVNHKDGNKKNNHVENLEWVTYGENNKHAYDTGLKIVTAKMRKAFSEVGKRTGKMNGLRKLTVRDVVRIRRMRDEGLLLREIAEKFPVTTSNIGQICKGRTW